MTQLQNALKRQYDRILFARDVLRPIFGLNFTLNSSLIPALEPTKSESASINKVGIYGNIRLNDGTEITCYEVLLQPQVRIEQNKVAVQQYVRKLLTVGQAALINFIAPANNNVWRFTLVARDSVLTEKGVIEKTTNAKRYTFLLGPSETCRTAAERFETLSTEPEITIQTLVNAFSVEKLSKAFFDEYTLHYHNFCNYLQGSAYGKRLFNVCLPVNASQEEKEKASKPIRDFVKKLLGRIVFLYFVQKKGWLGASNTKYTDGQSDFIKQLFKQSGAEDTFYCSWLKTLFFDTLNKERANDDFEMPDGRRVKVPFLNGGLFDKEEFDEQFLILEAKLFYNPDFEDVILTAKNNGSARGFLDFLDAFNFTVYEDSPDEQTVAVDPEMLGHIFENLLEDNKDKGAYYTPKEIVHYMCQESLIEYLCTTLKIEDDTKEKEAIVALLQHKELYPILMPKISDVDEALDRVKICDPAIGSGAFPMGLLQEIFSMKELIAYETDKEWNPAETKLNIIQNSIYGVDIEKGAVDIARLRFWLSLVVDEEKPKPLPNLDYKIVVGDSLISKFDGEIVEIDWERKSSVGKADDYVKNVQRLLGEIANKQKNYFNPNNKNKKKLQAEIRNLKIELLINQLSYNKLAYVENTPQKGGFMPTAADIKHNTERELHIAGFKNLIDKLKYLSKRHDEPFNYFDWKLDFPEVLNPYLVNGNGGFDIVIGNPPYVRQERIGSEYKELLKNRFPSVANGIADMYVYFFGIGLELLKVKGVLSYITLNKYLKTKYGRELRNLLATRYDVDIIIDFFELPVFEASTDACITKIIATKGEIETKYFPVKTLDNLNLFELISGNFQKVVKDETEWKFMDSNQESILEKIYANTINLEKFTNNQIYRGITTAFNRAFILEDDIAEKLLNSESKSLVKPYAQSKDIKQWHLENTNKYFLATGYSIDVKKEFPTAYNYLHQFEQELKQRQDKGINWWNLRACKYYNNFEKPKIIYMHTAKKHEFYFDTEGRYINNSCYMIISDSQFLFCFLNSKLFEWFKKIKFVAYGDAEESGRAKLDYNKMITVPIKNVSKSIEKTFTNLVQNIKTNKSEGKNTIALEQQIDNLIYCLYELSYDEVKEIDPDFPLTKEEYERIVIE